MSGHDASSTITALQSSMQEHLERMTRDSTVQIKYMSMARNITSHIKAFGDGHFKIDVFFTRPSPLYWHDEKDPHLFLPTLISYCFRLEREPKREAPNLFHYLYMSWQTMVKSGLQKTFKYGIRKCMERPSFVEFMLEDFMPTMIRASFETHCWPLCSDIFGATIKYLKFYLSNASVANRFEDRIRDKMAFHVYKNVLNILKLVSNILHTSLNYHTGTLKMCLKFWMAIAYELRMYVNNLPEHKPGLRALGVAFEELMNGKREEISGRYDRAWSASPYQQFDVQESVRLTPLAISHLRDYTRNGWEYVKEDDKEIIRSMDRKFEIVYRLDPKVIFNAALGSSDIWWESLED